jgi:hypothetical protein
MLANGFSNNNYQIVQSPGAVVIVIEMIHDARIVRLNSRHRTDDVRPYFGDSIGWWEGDTLVVETTHIPQSQAYMGAWKDLKVTERFKRVAGDRLHYAFQIEDKLIWDAAWGGEYEFNLLKGQRIHEYACHEGNYSLHGILAQAKAETEKAEAAKAGGKAKRRVRLFLQGLAEEGEVCAIASGLAARTWWPAPAKTTFSTSWGKPDFSRRASMRWAMSYDGQISSFWPDMSKIGPFVFSTGRTTSDLAAALARALTNIGVCGPLGS